jgi:isocitrate lyase
MTLIFSREMQEKKSGGIFPQEESRFFRIPSRSLRGLFVSRGNRDYVAMASITLCPAAPLINV